MIQTWQIAPRQNTRLDINASNLDEVTRQLPDGYYSTFRTYQAGTRVLGLRSHLQRLYEPVPRPDVDETHLRRQLFTLLEPYRPGESRVRAVMTRQGQVYLAIAPLTLWPASIYEQGVRVETTQLQRQHPRLKSTNFIGRSDAERKHIAAEGIFEALLARDGYLLEGMTSNFFFVGQADNLPYLGTAHEDILLGITRATVIEIARRMGLAVRERPLPLDQVQSIDEAFITSSSRGVVPVIRIDDVTVGQGSPGPITKQLSVAYEAYVAEHAENIL